MYSFKMSSNKADLDHTSTHIAPLEVQAKTKPQKTYHNECRLTTVVALLSFGPFYLGYMLTYFSNFSKDTNKAVFGDKANETVFHAVLISAIPVGAIFGAGIGPLLMSLMARRNLLLLTNIVALVVHGIILIENVYLFLVCRIIQGALVGVFMGVVPVYIREITPKQRQGSYGVFTQMFLVIGIVYSFSWGLGLKFSGIGHHGYFRTMSSLNAPFLVVQVICILTDYIPKSPNSLIINDQEKEAKEVIAMFTVEQFVEQTYQNKKEEVEVELGLKEKKDENAIHYSCRAYFLAFEIPFMQQMTGITAILTQSQIIVEEILPKIEKFVPISINSVQIFAVLATVCILSRFGRRPLYLFGNLTMGIINLAFAILFIFEDWGPAGEIIFGIMIFQQIVFSLAVGSVVWLYVPEIVPARFVPYATMLNWLGAAITVILTPIVTQANDGNPYIVFFFFGTITLVFYVCNYCLVVETKDKSAKQVTDLMNEPIAICKTDE